MGGSRKMDYQNLRTFKPGRFTASAVRVQFLVKIGYRSSARGRRDRKSTRLNSSHVAISYAVFCVKKKNQDPQNKFGHKERLNPHESKHPVHDKHTNQLDKEDVQPPHQLHTGPEHFLYVADGQTAQ